MLQSTVHIQCAGNEQQLRERQTNFATDWFKRFVGRGESESQVRSKYGVMKVACKGIGPTPPAINSPDIYIHKSCNDVRFFPTPYVWITLCSTSYLISYLICKPPINTNTAIRYFVCASRFSWIIASSRRQMFSLNETSRQIFSFAIPVYYLSCCLFQLLTK